MKIQTIVVRSHDTSFGGYPFKCEVVVKIDAKEWTKIRSQKQLGQLYGVDISNEVYALTNQLVPAHNPSVNDTNRAKAGIKTIFLTYYMRDCLAAEKLGCEVIKTKRGEVIPGFGACSVVYDSRQPRISLVR